MTIDARCSDQRLSAACARSLPFAPIPGGAVPGPQGTFHQCRVNAYDCRDFSSQFEAQAVYWACGGRENDLHRLDRDRNGWACEAPAEHWVVCPRANAALPKIAAFRDWLLAKAAEDARRMGTA